MSVELPNVRKLFLPDPGYAIYEADLVGADAQVVAWEAEDEDLKASFRSGLKLHLKNAKDMFPNIVKGWSDDAIKATDRLGGVYHNVKRGVHGTNYGVSAWTLSQALGWTIREAEAFQQRWFSAHPGIRQWHQRTLRDISLTRSVTNKFGYRRTYFDRIDGLLPQALAWTPQSTVALVTFYGAIATRRNTVPVIFLLQGHDSLIFQIKIGPQETETLRQLKRHFAITVPYDDPLVIPWGLSKSLKSWGDCEKINWPEDQPKPGG